MTGPLPDLDPWQQIGDVVTDCQVEMLRQMAARMAGGLDRDAMAAVEGGVEWRDLGKQRGDRYAG